MAMDAAREFEERKRLELDEVGPLRENYLSNYHYPYAFFIPHFTKRLPQTDFTGFGKCLKLKNASTRFFKSLFIHHIRIHYCLVR